MTAYWLLFAIWALGSVQFTRGRLATNSIKLFVLASVLTILMIGLRFEVGGDWLPYQAIYETIYFQSFIDALGVTDPGYATLNWVAIQLNFGIWAVNLVCGALFVFGIGRLALRQPNPWLAVLVAVPYFIIVVAMGYTRQAASIGIICIAIADAKDTNFVRTIVLVAVAALFHKTAILMLPVLLLPIMKRNFLIGALGGLAFVILFAILLGGKSDTLVANYAQSNYDSQGAAIRVAMNVVAGIVFLTLRGRMPMPDYQRSLWTYNALLSLLSVFALVTLSASSGVDRLALFLIPLQMMTYSRLPYVLSGRAASIPLLFATVAYAFAVEFVWLNFADNADSWVPYHTVLSSLINR
jgi:hypothetical protein